MVRRFGWMLSIASLAAVSLAGAACAGGDEPSFRPARASAEDLEARPPGAARPPASTERVAAPSEPSPQGALEVPAPGSADIAPADIVPVQAQGAVDPRLLQPSQLTERAPDQFVVELDTTEGPVRIEVTRAWSPNGADRFYNLVRVGYFTDIAFFRVIDGFMAQAGIHGSPEVNRAWRGANIPDDPPVQHNTRGMVSYAMGGPGTRTTQFFISFGDNSRLDSMGFAPFGRVLDMAPIDRLHAGYGEGAPSGRGPAQARLQQEGNAYLRAEFPELDYIRSARIVSGGTGPGPRVRPPG